MSTVERELKLKPVDEAMLDRLAAAERVGAFSVGARRRELQRNSFFDSPARALGRARVGFRRRAIQGHALATWTLKAESEVVRGVASRAEIELQLAAEAPPGVALAALRDAARQRGAAVLAQAVDGAIASDSPPLAMPFLEMETDRHILDLESSTRGWSIELALDRVRLLGHAYAEVEIEAELKHGDEAALDAIREAIEGFGVVEDSAGGKLSRALAHVAACSCLSR